MDDKLELFHEILFGSLRPGRSKNEQQLKFRELKKNIIRQHYQYQPKYQINFLSPHTEKSEYYKELISNESIRYFNSILEAVHTESDDDIKYLWVHNTLFENLTDKLKQVAAEIEHFNYPISNIDPSSKDNKLKDTPLSENAYIYQYLKISLIQLYLNIQDSLRAYFEEGKLEEREIYVKFFSEAIPTPSFLIESQKIEAPIKKEVKKKEEVSFNLIYQDIRPIIKSKADYSIINNQELFGEVEKRLYEYELIDNEYCFIKSKKQSNHTLLAAVYKVLINNNYFRRNKIGTHYKFTDLDIRKYLDERYSADTSQQFRRIKDKQVEDAKLKLPWLDKIYPTS